MSTKIGKKVTIFLIFIFFVLFSPSTFAQTTPIEVRISTNGTITATKELHESMYVGGSFTEVQVNDNGAVERNNFAEVDVEDAMVTSWNPQPDAPVHDIQIYGEDLYIAGQFTKFNTQSHPYLVAVNSISKEVTNLDISVNSPVYALGIYKEMLYMGGSFTKIQDEDRNYFASYNLDTDTLTTWSPDMNDTVYDIAIDENIIYVAGAFTTVNGVPRNHIAAFQYDTGELTNWNPSVDAVITHIEVAENTIVVTGYIKKEDNIEGKKITINRTNNNIILEEPLVTKATPFQDSILSTHLTPEPTEATVAGLMVDQKELGFQIPTLSDILTFAIRGFFVIAGLAALFFLLLGAFGWVTSGGDQESVNAARGKIQAAIIGLLMMVAVLAIVWTLEQVIFNRRLCFGISCPVTIPALLEPAK